MVSDPEDFFSANTKGVCALCLRNSMVCFGYVTKVPGRWYMPYRHEKEKHWEQCRVEMGFSSIRVVAGNYIILALSHLINDFLYGPTAAFRLTYSLE